MARNVYTDKDRARVALTLQANEGNIRRTARETGVPVMTVGDWKRHWDREGYPEAIQEALPMVREEFLEEAETVRWMMLSRLRDKIESGEGSVRDLMTGIGILTDKIHVMKGLATSRTETVHTNAPDPKEFAKELAQFVAKTVDDANIRNSEIEDADWEEVGTPVPVKALPQPNR